MALAKVGEYSTGRPKYPWKQWLTEATRRKVTLVQGRQFEVLPHTMAQQVRNAALRYAFRVSIQISAKSITIEAAKIRRKQRGR